VEEAEDRRERKDIVLSFLNRPATSLDYLSLLLLLLPFSFSFSSSFSSSSFDYNIGIEGISYPGFPSVPFEIINIPEYPTSPKNHINV